MKLTKKALCLKFSAASVVSATVVGDVVTADEWQEFVKAKLNDPHERWTLESTRNREWLNPPDGSNLRLIPKRPWLRNRIGMFCGSSTGEFWFADAQNVERSYGKSVDLILDEHHETLSLVLMDGVSMVYRIVEAAEPPPCGQISAA